MQNNGFSFQLAASRATDKPHQTMNPPKCRPIRPKPSFVGAWHLMGLHFGNNNAPDRDLIATNRGNCTTRASGTPTTHRQQASCSAKPPSNTNYTNRPGRGAGGWRQSLSTHKRQAPTDWRPPRGLRGQAAVPVGGGRARAGLEIDHSERSSRVAISRAGRRPPAHTAARPNKTGPAAAGDLSGQQATRRPEHPWGNKQHETARPHRGPGGSRIRPLGGSQRLFQRICVPAAPRRSQASTTRAAMPASADLPHVRGSYCFLMPTSPSILRTPS